MGKVCFETMSTELRICSSTYGLNISALIFHYEVIFACCIAKKQPPEVFWKKGVLKLYKFHRKASVLESLFNKGLKTCNFIKERLQHKCFPAKFAKPLKTLIFENIYITCDVPWLLLKPQGPISYISYFARSKFSRSLVHMKIFSLT